jgi:hypothetical protein
MDVSRLWSSIRHRTGDHFGVQLSAFLFAVIIRDVITCDYIEEFCLLGYNGVDR